MKRKIVILGAGAIGRGYLPWVLPAADYDLIFVDANQTVIAAMRDAGKYTTYRIRNNKLESLVVPVHEAYLPQEFQPDRHRDVAACFLCVGPRNVAKAAGLVKGTMAPLILCENEPYTVEIAKRVVGHERVYFAVPDVITSNTAPAHLLQKDALSVVTEDGTLFIEEGPAELGGDFQFLSAKDLFNVQWTSKLYLHNTPHCIAAYLGALVGATYIHEAMEVDGVSSIVAGAMDEMLRSLKLKWDIPHDFLQWYADKELTRFRSPLLFDPVSRVAREPLRKLEMHGRLIGAAQICLSLGIVPANILAGITGALLFENESDPDHHLVLMRRAFPPDLFNTYILGLRKDEPLDLVLREQMESMVARLALLPKVDQRG